MKRNFNIWSKIFAVLAFTIVTVILLEKISFVTLKPKNAESSSERPVASELPNTQKISKAEPVLTSETSKEPEIEGEISRLNEVKEIQTKVEDIYNRTQFDYTKMTAKEYEDALALLKEYNRRVREVLAESKRNHL